MTLLRTLLRVGLGGLLAAHGAQKLLGWFGGSGLAGTTAELEAVGVRPARANALAAGGAQLGGGALIALGLLHPAACTAANVTLLTAVPAFLAPNGPWARNGGYEYPLVLSALLVALAAEGPGPLSLDRRLGLERAGAGVAAASLAAAVAASAVVVASATPPRD